MSRADDPHFCHTSLLIFTFSNHQFSECCCGSRENTLCGLRHVRLSSLGGQNLAVVLAILQIRKYVIFLRPLLSSTSYNNDSDYKHSWTAPFLFSNLRIAFSSTTQVIISISGLPLFCWCDQFSKSSYSFWKYSHFGASTDSLILSMFHICCISTGQQHILVRRWIR